MLISTIPDSDKVPVIRFFYNIIYKLLSEVPSFAWDLNGLFVESIQLCSSDSCSLLVLSQLAPGVPALPPGMLILVGFIGIHKHFTVHDQ